MIIFAIMFVLFYIIFNYTKFGYNVRACASSQRIAKNSGVNTKKTAFLCYVVSSLFLGVAALLKISIQGSIDTPMYMSSTNIIFNCMLGIYVGLALEQYCNLVIGIFIGNFKYADDRTSQHGTFSFAAGYSIWNLPSGYYDLYLQQPESNELYQ